MMNCPYDVTYCVNESCPFKDCDVHFSQIKKLMTTRDISIADYSGTCRRYIGYLVDVVSKEEQSE